MKKIFLFAAAAMVSLSSCVQSEDVYTGAPAEMGFKSAVTRAIINSNDEFTQSIAVAAVLDDTNDGAANYVEYFPNGGAKFVYDAATQLWKGEPARYWPSAGHMHFLAFSPYPSSSTITTNYKTDGTIENMNVKCGDNNIMNQHDVLFSDLLSVDAPQTAAQALQFHHALSQINITFKKTDSAANVVLNSVLLNDVFFTGQLTIVPTEGAASTATWATPSADFATYRFFNRTDATSIEDSALDAVLSSSEAYSPNPLLIVPMAQQTSLKIVYTVDGHQQEYVANLAANGDWKMGHKYTYNFVINVNEIIFDCEVDEWIPVDGGTITI